MEYELENDMMERMARGKRLRRRIAVCLMAAAALYLLWWRGYLPYCGTVGHSDAWRNISGTDECFPFRVNEGKGFVYQGTNYDNPCESVATRPDWTISRFGRTYVLFDVNPVNMEPWMPQDVTRESLWIGLLGEDGEIVRKTRLATGVRDISGIRRALRVGAYVSATRADGSKTIIVMRFPRPWPALRPTGDSWKDFEQRRQRLLDKMWEDWPGDASGYAADWVSMRLEENMEDECRHAIDRLKAMAASDARRNELEAEYVMARSFAWKFTEDSSDAASNVHWENFTDRDTRMRIMEIYLRNWLEAADRPEGWDEVRSAQGVVHDVHFAATSGVAVLSVPTSWVYRRWAEKDGKDSERLNPSIDETWPEKWQLLMRLSPKCAAGRDGVGTTDYEIIAPGVQDSGYMVGNGTVRIAGLIGQ